MEEGYKSCPYCAETIREAATVCRYCNRALGDLGSAKNAPPSMPIVAKNPWRAILSIMVLFAVLLLLFWAYTHSSQAEAERQNAQLVRQMAGISPTAATAHPAPQPPPQPQFFKTHILQGQYEIGGGQIQAWTYEVPTQINRVGFSGAFRAFGGRGNDIELVICTPFDFENWKNGHPTNVVYASGKVTTAQVNVPTVAPGKYVIALDNRFSAFARKQVTMELDVSGYLAQ